MQKCTFLLWANCGVLNLLVNPATSDYDQTGVTNEKNMFSDTTKLRKVFANDRTVFVATTKGEVWSANKMENLIISVSVCSH